MFFTSALVMIIAAKIAALFLALGIIAAAGAIVAGIVWGVNSYYGNGEDEDNSNLIVAKKAKKFCTTWSALAICGIVFTTVLPTTKEFLILATFKGVDTYNTTHPESLVSVNGIVGTADNVMKIFQDSLLKVDQLLDPPKPAAPQK